MAADGCAAMWPRGDALFAGARRSWGAALRPRLLRALQLEPLEDRRLLAVDLSFTGTPFAEQAGTNYLVVNYHVAGTATENFSVTLNKVSGGTTALTSVTVPASTLSPVTTGDYQVVFDQVFSDPQSDYSLQVSLDAPTGFSDPTANNTLNFEGAFLTAGGAIEVFGGSSADHVHVGAATGVDDAPLVRVTINDVDHFYDAQDVTDIHVRTRQGADSLDFDDLVDVGLWAFGGDGADSLYGSSGANYIDGGEGNDHLYAGPGTNDLHGGSNSDTVTVLGAADADYIFDVDDTLYVNDETVTVAGVETMVIYGGEGSDEITLAGANLKSWGLQFLAVFGEDGDDTLALYQTEGGGTGLGYAILSGGADNDVIFSYEETVTHGSGDTLAIYGDDGDDQIGVYEPLTGTLAPATIDGGDGADVLFIGASASSAVTADGESIAFSASDSANYSGIEQLDINTLGVSGNAAVQIVTTGATPLPNVTVNGAAGDTLSLASEAGGSISATFSAVTNKTTFVVDGAATSIVSGGVNKFDLDSADVSIHGIALNQFYDVTTDYVDPLTSETNHDGNIHLDGAVKIPTGFTASAHQLLLANRSSAILHGRFTGDTGISVGSDDYDVEYVNDIALDSESYSGGVQVTTSLIITHDDNVPRFVLAFAERDSLVINRSLDNGDWSDPDNWSAGHVPTAGELVRITAGTTIHYDLNDGSTSIRAIEVVGSLVFDTEETTHMLVGTIEVLPGGALVIGDETTSVSSSVSATVTIADDLPDYGPGKIDNKQYGTGLIAFGQVSIHGSPIGEFSDTNSQTWLRLAAEPIATHTSILLSVAAPDGWNEGDELVLPDTRQAPTGNDYKLNATYAKNNPNDIDIKGQTEIVVIDHFSLDRKTVYLTTAIQYNHKGGYNSSGTLEILPHVALLNRNVTIESEHADGYRGHTLYGGRADVDIEYARFLHLGRTDAMVPLGTTISVPNTTSPGDPIGEQFANQIARYPVHFHHMAGPINVSNTGYQYKFIGNTVEDGKKWSVAVHNTNYGLLADNVVYDAQGSGFMTEDGSEVANVFANNIVIKIHGTYEDGNAGLDEGGDQKKNDQGRGGVGFWFRRTGNDFIGNVSADTTYGGVVISSYYFMVDASLPNFRGANTHVEGEFTPTKLNPAGTIANNEIYSSGQVGMWAAYLTGDNMLADQPEVVFDHLTIWNGALRTNIDIYHVAEVTFDHLLILNDGNVMNRDDWGAYGITMANYENLHTQILNSRLEGNYIGLVNTPTSGIPFGGPLVSTVVENTVFKNYINVMVVGAVESRVGQGNSLELNDDLFTMIPWSHGGVSGNPVRPSANIDMVWPISDPQAEAKYSIVQVHGYNQNEDDNFQVYYSEQAPDAIMEASDWSWYLRYVPGSTAAPPGSYLTNQQAWDTYGIATAGMLAPTNATTRAGINGLVGAPDEFQDPTTWDPKVVLVTPWDGSEFIGQVQDGIYVMLRYVVQGMTPEGGGIQFSLQNGSGTPVIYDAPVADSIFWGQSAGNYTLRAYMVDDEGHEVSGTATEAHFSILAPGVHDETFAPVAGTPSAIKNTSVKELLIATGGEVEMNRGMIITGASGVQGHWQYYDTAASPDVWTNVPGTVSATSGVALPAGALVRFVVDSTYSYSSGDAAPVLTFMVWDQAGATSFATNVDTTTDPGDHFKYTAITVTQPLVAPPVVQDVVLYAFPVDALDQEIKVEGLLLAANVSTRLAYKTGLVISGASGAQGVWQYTDAGGAWHDVPSDVSTTSAFALGPKARIRFVVSGSYTYSALDADPQLTFYTWDQPGAGDYSRVNTTTSTHVGDTAIHVTQGLLPPA